ncbi:hypothetical protein [Rhizobium terrae]|uniref:hypothetical protein n=1 Tax=Rhizobium terrae TaxID=2171756 RepID=UPI000E3E3735|nr:hypothetical protein [Rhizobium terrae]
MTKITSITLLLASAVLTTPAFAEGEYYEGVQRQSPIEAVSPMQNTLGDHSRTFYFPGSDATALASKTSRDNRKIGDSGDYYEGVSRPN